MPSTITRVWCVRCGAPFTPSKPNQKTCSQVCKRVHDQTERRPWRGLVRAVARDPGYADGIAEYRAADHSPRWATDDGTDLSAWTVPDRSAEVREANLQSYLHSQSGQLAYQLHGWLIREADRKAHGHPASYEAAHTYGHARDDTGRLVVVRDGRRQNVPERGGFRRAFVPLESCDHGTNGVVAGDCAHCALRNRPERAARLSDYRPMSADLSGLASDYEDYAEEMAA